MNNVQRQSLIDNANAYTRDAYLALRSEVREALMRRAVAMKDGAEVGADKLIYALALWGMTNLDEQEKGADHE